METTLIKTKTQYIKDIYDSFDRGDIQFIVNQMDEDIKWNVSGKGLLPQGGFFSGRKGVLDFFKALGNSIKITKFEPKEFIESDDRVIVLGSYESTALKTGKSAVTNWVMCWKFRDGIPVEFDEFNDFSNLYHSLN